MVEFHVTYPGIDMAAQAARSAVEAGLAACANIVGDVRSIYRWQGTIADETEALAIFKTSHVRAGELFDHLRTNHPYEIPAIIRHDGVTANDGYLRWVEEETGK